MVIGIIPIFYSKNSDWLVYAEKLEQFVVANDISEEKKKAILLMSILQSDYKILRDVCHPILPKDKSFSQLIEVLNRLFVQRTSVFRERYNFYNARQNVDETIINWFTRIKNLSIDCKFDEQHDDILLDRFISGMAPSVILDRLC